MIQGDTGPCGSVRISSAERRQNRVRASLGLGSRRAGQIPWSVGEPGAEIVEDPRRHRVHCRWGRSRRHSPAAAYVPARSWCHDSMEAGRSTPSGRLMVVGSAQRAMVVQTFQTMMPP